jgi:chromosome segregation ATPase
MHKELNPDLFGEKKISKSAGLEAASSLSSANNSYLNTDRQIFEIKAQNQALADQMNKIVGTVNELIKSTNSKFERQSALLSRLEQSHNGLATEAGQKITQLSQRVNERKSLDLKVQEMVDRHNNIIKSFEVRMNHLQKLLAEKEAQMISSQTALNEAKMEIARLKRL